MSITRTVRLASTFSLALLLAVPAPLRSQAAAARLTSDADRRAALVEAKVIAWRRDFHEHPELSNRETRTAGIVAAHLKKLGIETRTGVAHTGVIGVLKGGRPGPVVALRADMDALPVSEQVKVPFASKVRTTYNGQEVGVMHACGHDAHTAMLMGVAEVLSGMRAELPGTVVFIFQPAEEGPPAGERGGARLVIEEGGLSNPAPQAIFGLHVMPLPAGQIGYRPRGLMASADWLRVTVHGRQTHGAQPWNGVDPITVASQIVLGLQTIPSRQLDVTIAPAIITIGSIHGGIRENIIPDSVVLRGTIRTFDPAMQKDVHARITRTAEDIARSAGARADVGISELTAVTYNDPALTTRMVPSLERVAGPANVVLVSPATVAEDFSYYQQKVPGLFVFLGIAPKDDPKKAAPNHSPLFYVDESALVTGVRTLSSLALDYLAAGGR
jgi:amidohydrolase